MTAPPVEQLVINRDRSALLASIRAGRVYRSLGGCVLLKAPSGRNNMRVDRRVRELRDHGLVHLGADGPTYALTAAGSAALESYVPPVGPREAR